MPRPSQEQPTPNELEALKVLWDLGPSTAREVWKVLREQRPRHYTSVNSLLTVMTEKGLVRRETAARAFVYEASVDREQALGGMVADLLGRAFEGSASALVLKVLDQCEPSQAEMDEIAQLIRKYRQQQGGK